ncbi:hypothetical protein AGMMS49982_17650 [Bacteroidia bacterium]|nr:hypothetical protein AGMMS49982_17650 [Bacteroidia bacterium]
MKKTVVSAILCLGLGVLPVAAQKAAQKSTQDVAREAARETAREVAEKVAQEAAEKAAQAVAEKVAQEVAERVAQEIAKKSAQESAQRVEQAAPAQTHTPPSYLPKAGDFAFGIDATPVLQFLGNLFTDAANTAPTFGNGVGIYGKYFLEDNRAVRAKLHLNVTNETFKQTVSDVAELEENPDNTMATVFDIKSVSETGLYLNAGYEWRVGTGRMQGFYGAELLLGYGGGKTITYEYGNPLTDTSPSPPSTTFGGDNNIQGGSRLIENKIGNTFGIGLGGFCGVEYFITTRLSIGGEVGIGFGYSSKGQNEFTFESYANNQVEHTSAREMSQDEVASKVGIETKPTGNFFVIFHF